MPKYNTKQRALLMDYLAAHPDEEFTAGEIASALEPQGISKSAVYRNLSELEEEGLLKRRTLPGSREIHYRYLGNEHCAESLHLSCKVCGRTIHMSNQETEFFVRTIAANDRFELDRHETVLYGTCRKCRKNLEKEAVQ
ncbi:MAG: transcriptional repressor [Lachnospiraceae bacterium]|nr:transcriptional repressor [Lachnospiraceae bacterium]